MRTLQQTKQEQGPSDKELLGEGRDWPPPDTQEKPPYDVNGAGSKGDPKPG